MKKKPNLNCIHGKHLGHDCQECRDSVTPEEKARLEYVQQAFANIASDLAARDRVVYRRLGCGHLTKQYAPYLAEDRTGPAELWDGR